MRPCIYCQQVRCTKEIRPIVQFELGEFNPLEMKRSNWFCPTNKPKTQSKNFPTVLLTFGKKQCVPLTALIERVPLRGVTRTPEDTPEYVLEVGPAIDVPKCSLFRGRVFTQFSASSPPLTFSPHPSSPPRPSSRPAGRTVWCPPSSELSRR